MKLRAKEILYIVVTLAMLGVAVLLAYRSASASRYGESILLLGWVGAVIIFAYERRLLETRESIETKVLARTEALRISDARHRGLIECMADAVFSADVDGNITLANHKAVELLGLQESELLGSPFGSFATSGSRRLVEAKLAQATAAEHDSTIEADVISRNRTAPVPVELKVATLTNEEGAIIGTQWVARDVTERKRFETELLDMASHDHLTGLFNRRALESELERELAKTRRTGSEGALIWLDLDDFKDVNDSLGHHAGDTVLYLLAEQLQTQVREADVLARLGGDEFAILMPETPLALAESAAHRILHSINAFAFLVDDQSVRMSASLGVAVFPRDGVTADEILANADSAMYAAKSRGRGNVQVHGSAQHGQQLGNLRLAWNARVESALKEDRFFICSQPVLTIATRDCTRHELLIRMRGDKDGLVYMPNDFLPSAERLGLINEIDRWMIHRAIDLLVDPAWEGASVEVNLSGKALVDPALLGFVAEALVESSVDPSRLGFEITETAAIADFTRAQSFMRAMREMGCRFSLDDFGSGFSSLYYLKHLPIDCLKIDRSFIQDLVLSREDRALVRGIVEMCRGLDVEIVAEGVEDQATLDAVEHLGCTYAQGFHIGRPLQTHGHSRPQVAGNG